MAKSIFGKKRTISKWLVLVGFLFLLSNVSFAMEKKHGNVLLIQTQNDQDIKGELLAVKGTTLILLDLETSSGIHVAIDTIRHIRIVRRAQILQGMGKGLVLGAGSGALLGFLSGSDTEGWFRMSAGEKALGGAIGLGILSLPVGGIWGALRGSDSSFFLDGRSPEEIQTVLKKLNARARFPVNFPNDINSILHPDSIREQRFKKRYNMTLNRVQKSDSNRKAPPHSFKRFHICYTPTYFHSNGTENHVKLFNEIGFGDTRPGGWSWFSYGPVEYPRVKNALKIKLKDFNLEFSLSKNFAIGLGYSTIGLNKTSGYKMIMLDYTDRWGNQYYSDLYLTGEFSGDMYYITGAWKPIPDGFLKRSSVELGIGLGVSLIDLNYLASNNSYDGDMAENFQAKKLGSLFIVFAEYDYYIGNSWSIGLKIDYKHAITNIESFQMSGNYLYNRDEYNNKIYRSWPIDIPEHKINTGGIGFGFTLGLHF